MGYNNIIYTILAFMFMGQTGGVIRSTSFGGQYYFVDLPKKNQEEIREYKANRIWKAGFFDPRSFLSALSFTQTWGAGQYFDFDEDTQLLTVAGDQFQLQDADLENLFGMLLMADNKEKMKESASEPYYKYKDQYNYYGESAQITSETRVLGTLTSKPLVIPSTHNNKTYIIDVQYKSKNYKAGKNNDIYFGSYIAYYFVLGISQNGESDGEIQNKASAIINPDSQIGDIEKLLVKIPFNNPYAYNSYYPYKSGDKFYIDITTGLEGSVTVELSKDDIKALLGLIKNYETNKSATHTKSDYVYNDTYPYRLTFKFEGKSIFVLPVYKYN